MPSPRTLPGFVDVLVSSIWALFSLGVGGSCAAGLNTFSLCTQTPEAQLTRLVFPVYGRRLLQAGYIGQGTCAAWGLAVAVG